MNRIIVYACGIIIAGPIIEGIMRWAPALDRRGCIILGYLAGGFFAFVQTGVWMHLTARERRRRRSSNPFAGVVDDRQT